MQTWLSVTMDGRSVSADLEPFVQSATYREALDGEADTLELTLQDIDGLFMSDWYPRRGMSIELSIENESARMPLGDFTIDEIENTFPPSECKIKATSLPPGSTIKAVERSRSWELVTLSSIAADIAIGAGLRLYYDTLTNPFYRRVEQADQSDLRFLHRLCSDQGLALKLNDRKLIIFDIEKYERSSAVATIDRVSESVKRFSARATLNEVYTGCEVTYKDSKKDWLYVGRASSGGLLNGLLGGGKTLRFNAKVESAGDAQRLATKKLREANRKETEITLTLIGNFRMRAGATIKLEGFYQYDGKYLIQRATHTVGGGGYETTVEMSRC